MENKIKIFLILVAISFVGLGIVLMRATNYNIYYEEYNNEGYSELEISYNRLKRYNEKLNNSIISYLVVNMNIILDKNDSVNNNGLIQYAVLFAKNYDYKYEENIKVMEEDEYINIKYLNKLIKKLFNVNIDISEENVKIIDKYVKADITEDVETDVYSLAIDKILYNKKDNTYLAYINYMSDDNGQEESMVEKDSTDARHQIVIRYKKNSDGINTILQYSRIVM